MEALMGQMGPLQISIHAPRAGCDELLGDGLLLPAISIHAPRAGCDLSRQRRYSRGGKFQSTHPVRGATFRVITELKELVISIHAPRAGCDFLQLCMGY